MNNSIFCTIFFLFSIKTTRKIGEKVKLKLFYIFDSEYDQSTERKKKERNYSNFFFLFEIDKNIKLPKKNLSKQKKEREENKLSYFVLYHEPKYNTKYFLHNKNG